MNNHNGQSSEDPGKRQAILEQAIRTFAELGFRRGDVQAIADRAGVGKGTVYRYFGSKEDLFWATTYEVMLRLEGAVFASMNEVEGAYAKIRSSALAYSRFFLDNPQYLELFLQDMAEFRGSGPPSHVEHRERMIQRIAEILDESIRRGEIRPVDTRKTIFALGSLLFGAVTLGSHLKALPVAEMAEYAMDIFLQGIQGTSHERNTVEREAERDTAGC